jgi:hypothetical protein
MSKSDRLPNNKPPRTRTDTETHTHAHSSVDCDSRGHMGTLDDLLFCSLSSHITQRIENTREISERFLISFDWIASDCMEWSILIIIVSSFSADLGDSKIYSRLFISCERAITTTSWAVFFYYYYLLSNDFLVFLPSAAGVHPLLITAGPGRMCLSISVSFFFYPWRICQWT